ncbi:hypothetical protein QUF72_06705 [Desulfobacterales bacterium HSG2]|nr:hypothetical protein [Desulfobacterales bacterium HSG2]
MSHFFSFARNDRWRWDTPKMDYALIASEEHPNIQRDSGQPLSWEIVVFRTVMAYTFENFGPDNYNKEKSRLPFRIRGMEQGGIFTFTDPLAANALIVKKCKLLSAFVKDANKICVQDKKISEG